jgi:hypothetical protein
MHVMNWTGLRGAVATALELSVPGWGRLIAS